MTHIGSQASQAPCPSAHNIHTQKEHSKTMYIPQMGTLKAKLSQQTDNSTGG